MIHLRETTDLVKWYVKVEDDRPKCLSCNLYLVKYEGTVEVFDDGIEAGILCRTCSSRVSRTEYDDFDDVRDECGGEERERACTETLAQERKARSTEFRSERARKATESKKSKASRSGSDIEGSSGESRGTPRVRRPKNSRDTKVRGSVG